MDDFSIATKRALARTRWLSDLAESLEEASRLVVELGSADTERVGLLHRQIATLLGEVDALRRARPIAPRQSPPKRTKF